MKNTIAKRLKAAREEKKWSRDKLLLEINNDPTRPTDDAGDPITLQFERYKSWENGFNAVNLDWIPVLCKHLSCDVGYLFGEYEEFTRQTSDVCAKTGLSQDAVNTLAFFSNSPGLIIRGDNYFSLNATVSLFLNNPSFYEMIRNMLKDVSDIVISEIYSKRKTFVDPHKQKEYDDDISSIETEINALKSIAPEYGYHVVADDDLLYLSQYRLNQSMQKVVAETSQMLINAFNNPNKHK